jgi:hypothetical protein
MTLLAFGSCAAPLTGEDGRPSADLAVAPISSAETPAEKTDFEIDVVPLEGDQEFNDRTIVELIDQAIDIASGSRKSVASIATPSGIGLVANGTVSYSIYPNPDATRVSQRQAIVEATYVAKANLAKYVYGLEAKTQMQLLSFYDQEIGEVETLEAHINEIILGAVVYNFGDTVILDEGVISLTLVTAPATRGKCATGTSASVLHADDIESAMAYINGSIALGTVPPHGGRRILLKDGTVAWAAFGSGTLSERITNPALRHADKRSESKAAQMRSRVNLLALIKGEDIETGFPKSRASGAEAMSSYETILDENGGESMRKLAAVEQSLLNSTVLGDKITSEVNGKLPAGVFAQMVDTHDEFWVTAVSVWYPPLSAEAERAMKDMQEGGGALGNTPSPRYQTNPDGTPRLGKDGKMQPVKPRPEYKADIKDL